MRQMQRIGLSLPSEAQWEYGARGGTSTSWWTGHDRESLRGKVNIADQTAAKFGASWPAISDWPDLDDGAAVHTEVGHYPANDFGLHEVTGNLWEWCLDGYESKFYSLHLQEDPVAPWEGSPTRVRRGGGFTSEASLARLANRFDLSPQSGGNALGLRPARSITQ